MPLNNQLVQIWIDLPGREYQETLQATLLSESLFQICEIPFITDQVNYMDIVSCQDAGETPRKVTEVFKSSGYSTIHLMFAEHTPKELIRQCSRVLLQKGVTYRRSVSALFRSTFLRRPIGQALLDILGNCSSLVCSLMKIMRHWSSGASQAALRLSDGQAS